MASMLARVRERGFATSPVIVSASAPGVWAFVRGSFRLATVRAKIVKIIIVAVKRFFLFNCHLSHFKNMTRVIFKCLNNYFNNLMNNCNVFTFSAINLQLTYPAPSCNEPPHTRLNRFYL